MEFDITHLDKVLLIQTLFVHSEPLQMGKLTYNRLKGIGDNVDGLSDEECIELLEEFNRLEDGGVKILDYHKGKPIKLVFFKNRNGRVLVDSGSYDVRNGKYKFFEALLNIFSIDEIYITKKGYKLDIFVDLQEHLNRPKKEIDMFRNIIKHTYQKQYELGNYWVIDETKVKYTAPLLT